MRVISRIALALLVMLAAGAAFAQDTGSVRGNVTDTTGAIVPGATVTLQNEATRFSRNVVTDAKGDYYFGAVSPGVYTITVEIPGFKMSSRKGMRISQREAAGYDFVLEVGAQTERIEVTATREMIQTQTGAREGLLTADQIDNLSVVGRSPLELLRILPGSVMPDVSSLESVGNLTGVSNTNQDAQYAVNGIRGSNTVVTLDGSRLADFGSNNGVIVVPNNDMVSEVKVQSSNYAAEFGSAGVQVNAITKGGSSEFHGTLYDLHAALQVPGQRPLELDHGDATAEERVPLPRRQPERPDPHPGHRLQQEPRQGLLLPRHRGPAPEHRLRLQPGRHPDRGPAQPATSAPCSRTRARTWPRATTVNIPGGYPGAGSRGPQQQPGPLHGPVRPDADGPVPGGRTTSTPTTGTTTCSASSSRRTASRGSCASTTTSPRTRRCTSAWRNDSETLEKARGAWWNSSSYDLPSSLSHENAGRSISANLTSVLSPTTTNEFLFTFSKLKLDIYHTNPEAVSLTALGFPNFQGPWGQQTDVAPVNLINTWQSPVGDLWDPVGEDLYAYNSSLMFTDTFTKVMNTHAIKAGVSVERARKDQNFQNNEAGEMIYSNWGNGSTGNVFADTLTARPSQATFGTKSLDGNFQLWNIDFFVQDSWKVKKNFTLEYGARFSKMTNNIERNGYGARFDATRYDPRRRAPTATTPRPT